MNVIEDVEVIWLVLSLGRKDQAIPSKRKELGGGEWDEIIIAAGEELLRMASIENHLKYIKDFISLTRWGHHINRKE